MRRVLFLMSLSLTLLVASCEKSEETLQTARRCEELGGLVIWDHDYPARVLSCTIPCNHPLTEQR